MNYEDSTAVRADDRARPTGRGPTSKPLDAGALHALSDDELNTLPFGVICLDRAGTVVRYNLAEARFARIDRAHVVGRNFFSEIARCTATPEFQGRFLEFIERAPGGDPGRGPEVVRFDYVFAFRFGAQTVQVEFLRAPQPDRVYVLINRKTFLPLPPDTPEEILAMSQAELAPREERVGVQRDTHARRRLAVPPALLEALRVAAARAGDPAAARAFLDAWGFAWGRLAAVDLETEVLEARANLLRDLPMVDAVDAIAAHLRAQGWGSLAVDFAPARRGAFVVALERNALAEARSERASAPTCHLFVGFFRAMFAHLANKTLAVAEVRCRAQGHPRCEFAVVGASRAATLAGALARGGDDMNAVLEALDAPR